MKFSSMLCVAMLLAGSPLLAWTTYLDFECAMTNAVLDRRMASNVTFTNQLAAFLAAPLDGATSNTAAFVQTACFFARFNETMDQDQLLMGLQEVSNLCSNAQIEESDWVFWGGRLMWTMGCFLNNDDSGAYQVASNMYVRSQNVNLPCDTNLVLRAFLELNNMKNVSLHDAILLGRGTAAAGLKMTNEVEAICNQLPDRLGNELRAILNAQNYW